MTQKETTTLKAEVRQESGKKVSNLRKAGKLPAVLYGHSVKNQNLVLNYIDFEKTLLQIDESSLVDLKIDNPVKSDNELGHGARSVKVLVHDIARHPVTHKIIHVDFYQVKMDEKIKTAVKLDFIGEAPAVKDLSGILVKALDHIEIECLPADLISNIEVDLSLLKTFDDIIRVKDLEVPEKVNTTTPPETAVVLVKEPKKVEEEEKPTEEEKPAEEGGEEKEEREKDESEKGDKGTKKDDKKSREKDENKK